MKINDSISADLKAELEQVRFVPKALQAFTAIAESLERGVSPNQELGVGFNMGDFIVYIGSDADKFYKDTYKDHTDDCGTVCCIAGHLSILLSDVPLTAEQIKEDAQSKLRHGASRFYWVEVEHIIEDYYSLSSPAKSYVREGLGDLFYVDRSNRLGNLGDITPRQAASAIRNFLESFQPQWDGEYAE